jgi:hypothetical protein
MVLEQFILGLETTPYGTGNNFLGGGNNTFLEQNQCLCGVKPMPLRA